ncbi:MAG: DUF4342 domain-containing protein [Patescibacteria group bacterium]
MPTPRKTKPAQDTFRINADEVVKKVRTLIKEGNIRRIIIQNEKGKTLMEIPLTFAIVGTMLAPILAAVGALAGVLTNCTLVVERKEP